MIIRKVINKYDKHFLIFSIRMKTLRHLFKGSLLKFKMLEVCSIYVVSVKVQNTPKHIFISYHLLLFT